MVEGYKYNKHVQVKVHCSGTPYRYTIQLNYKGTGKVATGTGTQYRYWYTAHLKIPCKKNDYSFIKARIYIKAVAGTVVQVQVHYHTVTGKGTQYEGIGKGTLFRYNVQVQVHVHCKGTVVQVHYTVTL